MAVTQKRLYEPGFPSPNPVSTSPSVHYTVPQGKTTIVKQVIFTNTTGSAKVVYLLLKPAGVALSNTEHDILSGTTLAANETLSFSCSIVLDNNGGIANDTNSDQLLAWSTASGVNITITGIEEG